MSAIEIPGYKIIKTLGVGGQATVYLAIQQGFDREVALKVMSPALAADPTFGERFIREAKIVATLSHPRIVTVYDVGESGSFYYLAMEYMRGKDLKSRVNQGLKAKDALLIIAKLAQALHFAHQKGYVHRDVKSENILFNDDDQPVLTDFGIAKASNSSTQMTQTGKLIGTPEYMSPEQCRGRKLDGRSDLYSLGIILYEMLTRRVPFKGSDSVSVCILHVTKPLPQLPARLNHFQWLIDKLLAKRADGRFQTGQELALAIRSYLKGEESSAASNNKSVTTALTQTQPQAQTQGNNMGRRDDFSEETFELNDEFEVEQRINVLAETKSRVPLITTSLFLVIAMVIAYFMKEQWLPKVESWFGQSVVSTRDVDNTNSKRQLSETKGKKNKRNSKQKINQQREKQGQDNSKQKITEKPVKKEEIVKLTEQENAEVLNRVNQLISQADTLAQYSPHELSDLQQALDHLVTAKSLDSKNENILTIKNNIIAIALEEAVLSAKKDQFNNADNWLKLVESAERDNPKITESRQIVTDYQLAFDKNIATRETRTKQLDENFSAAALALSEKRFASPENNNAAFYYSEILKIDADNAKAKKGLNEVADIYTTLVEQSIEANNFQKARKDLILLKNIPHNDSDFSKIENRMKMAKQRYAKILKEKRRRAAIAEEKIKIEKIRQEKLSDPLLQMRLQSKLQSANGLFDQARLVEPIGDNALEKYHEVLLIDALEPMATQRIKDIERIIIDNIEVALSNQIVASAKKWTNKLKIFNEKHPKLSGYQVKLDEMMVMLQMEQSEEGSIEPKNMNEAPINTKPQKDRTDNKQGPKIDDSVGQN